MTPWDFGLISALRRELCCPVFPSQPPADTIFSTYLLLDLQKYHPISCNKLGLHLNVSIIDSADETTTERHKLLQALIKLSNQDIQLSQGDICLGRAKIRIDSVVSKENGLILSITAIIQLNAIYEDITKEMANA